MVGVIATSQAMEMARKAGLDLVEIANNPEAPVCRILNYSKFKYESKKKAQDAKKKQKTINVKEIKFKPNIGDGDFDVKIKKIKEFVADGDKVKISLWFKGREIVHNDVGMQLFERIMVEVQEVAKIELRPKMEGKQIIMIVGPMPAIKPTIKASI